MKLSLASSRRSVDAVICTGASAVLLNAMAQVGPSDERSTAQASARLLALPEIQGSIFLADFSHLLRGHG